MSIDSYSRNPFVDPALARDVDLPPTGSRVLAGVDLALAVWTLAVLVLGLVTRSAAHGMAFNDYTDYRPYGGWIGLNASLYPLVAMTILLSVPGTGLLVIGSVVALVAVRRDHPRTFRVLLAATIALLLATATLWIVYATGGLLFISNLN